VDRGSTREPLKGRRKRQSGSFLPFAFCLQKWIGVKSVVVPELENGFDTDFCVQGRMASCDHQDGKIVPMI
jgi:hypothetical protein